MFFPVDRESLMEATSGAIGALSSTIVLYPLDMCKPKLQAELQTHQGMHKYRYGGPTPLPSPLFLPWHISYSEITSVLQCLLHYLFILLKLYIYFCIPCSTRVVLAPSLMFYMINVGFLKCFR